MRRRFKSLTLFAEAAVLKMPTALLKCSLASKGSTSTFKLLVRNFASGGNQFTPRLCFGQDRVTSFSLSFHASATNNGQKIVKLALKKERSKAKSVQLLRDLRAKKLAGLAPRAVDERRITKERSLKRLLAIYESKRSREELTQSSKVRILERIAKAAVDGKLNSRKHNQTLQSLVENVLSGVRECDESSICRILLALVQLNNTRRDYFERLQSEILNLGLTGFSHEELSEMCWAFGMSNFKPEELLESVNDEFISRNVSSFSSRSLCQFIWFFQDAPNESEIFDTVGSELLTRNMSEFESWMLGIIAWGYSKGKLRNRQVLKAIEYELHTRELKALCTKDLVLLITALAKGKILQRKLFQLLESALILKRDIPQSVPIEDLQELYDLLKDSPYCRAEIMKIVGHVLYPGVLNSIFDVMYKSRIAWKEKVLKQSLFRPY